MTTTTTSATQNPDISTGLWALSAGALINLGLLVFLLTASGTGPRDFLVLTPAAVLYVVSAFRCVFPNRYEDQIVFHDTPLSSIMLTRLLATAVEVSWIFQFSHVLRRFNVDNMAAIEIGSWLMVVQVVVSQMFVWTAILTGRLRAYVFEEAGWAVIFVINTVASITLLLSNSGTDFDAVARHGRLLLVLNVVWGVLYLPWQTFHLRSLLSDGSGEDHQPFSWQGVLEGARIATFRRRRRTDAQSWGGVVGLTWMVGYWATVIPLWVHVVVVEVGRR